MTDRGRLLRNPDHAFDPADDAADHTAHDATDHGTDWTGGALAYGHALLTSTHNALGLGRKRRRKRGNNDDSHDELRLHEQTPLPMFAVRTTTSDLLSVLWRQREANVAANQQNRSGVARVERGETRGRPCHWRCRPRISLRSRPATRLRRTIRPPVQHLQVRETLLLFCL